MTTVFKSVKILFDLIEMLIIIRVFMGIFRVSFDNIVGKTIYELTEPILSPAKAFLNKLGLDRGMIDFSPWVAIILLRTIYSLIVRVFW